MKELVIISGKGGTGKTSITASLSYLSKNCVITDCDVDAADMHLILKPDVKLTTEFEGGKEAIIDSDKCTQCGKCIELCRFDAISIIDGLHTVNPIKCDGCGVCAWFCPVEAIEMKQKIVGNWFISDTRHGTLVHAALHIAEDNSGKLVSKVRQIAKEEAEKENADIIITDGSPGIGCPVIASMTGANLVLIVTEPTVSGLHDLKRVVELINHFRIQGMVCINKYDLNENMAKNIEDYCSNMNIPVTGKIPYDTDFTKAQIKELSIVEYSDGTASKNIKQMWDTIIKKINQ